MKKVSLPYYYFIWHYTIALEDIMRLRATFSSFIVKYFSLKLLALYIFTPLFRSEIHDKDASIGDKITNIFYNLFTRIMGLIARSAMIFCGLLTLLMWNLGILIIFIIWILWPLILFLLISAGIKIALT